MATTPDRLLHLLGRQPVPLDRVMATVASVASDALTEDEVVAVIDALAVQAVPSGPERPIPPSAEDLLAGVFGGLGFVGNSADYYSPDNSLIHRVLATRQGIPLTLAMVGVEIGRRVGVELSVVGLPGHVLLGDGPSPQRWFDPFAGGAELDLAGCRALFGRFHPIESFVPAMVAPIDPVAATHRMLTNLKLAYRNRGELGQMARVLELSVSVPGSPVAERIELAAVLATLGRSDQAAQQHEILAGLDPDRAELHRTTALRHLARRN